jgi:hypothetical protein
MFVRQRITMAECESKTDSLHATIAKEHDCKREGIVDAAF